MTQEQKRILIAEACGWKRHYNTDTQWRYDGDGPDDWIVVDELPDYFNDLNAMHEARSTLASDKLRQYGLELNQLCVAKMRADGCITQADFDNQPCWIFHTDAAMQAEAFGRTLGLWP